MLTEAISDQKRLVRANSMTDARQIAVIRSGQGYNAFDLFLQTFFKRRVELGISGETLDDITGLTTRYSQKILEGKKLFGRQSFGEMLGGLAIQITISEDREALEKIQKRLERSPLDESQIRVHANARMCVPRWLFNPRKASKAAKKRWAKVPKKKRARAARKAARIRWSKPRVVDITQTRNCVVDTTATKAGVRRDRPARSKKKRDWLIDVPDRRDFD